MSKLNWKQTKIFFSFFFLFFFFFDSGKKVISMDYTSFVYFFIVLLFFFCINARAEWVSWRALVKCSLSKRTYQPIYMQIISKWILIFFSLSVSLDSLELNFLRQRIYWTSASITFLSFSFLFVVQAFLQTSLMENQLRCDTAHLPWTNQKKKCPERENEMMHENEMHIYIHIGNNHHWQW